MLRTIILWAIWAVFIAYALLFAPNGGWANVELLINLFTLQWGKINAIILSEFALVGIWLMIYSSLLFIDGRMQKVPFWLFAILSVGTGVIGLIPYLALREPNQEFSGRKDAFLNLLDSRSFGVMLSITTIVLLTFGFTFGDWGEFIEQFLTLRFVNGMTVAFCLFCVLFSTVLGDDMARRGLNNPQAFWAVALVPLFGSLAYLCVRPPLRETSAEVAV